ncbi:hypothetical protein ABRY74_22945 [Pseudomonas guariconensis]|uniref:hypothetical protein n=1 Tax=Pseudomonas guariconensis TaxID=1288410 RepID=UPI003EE1AB47
MQIRNTLFIVLFLPGLFFFSTPAKSDESPDTFDKLLKKQAEVLESEMDLKLQQNRTMATGGSVGASNPLPGVKQEVNEQEPTVEAIWGLAGQEVAEINYKGRRVPVSMQDPFISQIDGWKLASIQQYQIQLVRLKGKTVVQRKTIMFDWMSSGTTPSSQPQVSSGPSTPIMPLTPSVNPQPLP